MVKVGPFLGPTSSPNCLVACPHATTSTSLNLNLALSSIHGEKRSCSGTQASLLFLRTLYEKQNISNIAAPLLWLVRIPSYMVFPPPDEGKFKFQTQPINPTFPNTSNITLDPGKCLFKIPKIIGVSAPEYRRGNLPSVLTSFQCCLLVYRNMVGTIKNKFLLQFHYMLSLDGT